MKMRFVILDNGEPTREVDVSSMADIERVLAEESKPQKFYFTFGWGHRHVLDGVLFDADCICEVEAPTATEARRQMIAAFGSKWAFAHDSLETMFQRYRYTRGIVPLRKQV